MVSHWLLDRLELFNDRPALIWQGRPCSFEALRQKSLLWLRRLDEAGIAPGTVLAIVGDYSPNVCALLIAAIINRNIVVPLTTASVGQHDEFLRLSEAAVAIHIDDNDNARFVRLKNIAAHPLLRDMSARNDAGLILFSSGSTGPSKATLLDFERLLARFAQVRTATRTLVFLQLDHIGGINTLFHGLCNGGTIVATSLRSVDAVCAAIDDYQVELLPTTPTFLRMMMIADAVQRHSLQSLRTVTYGTEPMPEATLAAARKSMPWLRFKQTYGLSELGILPTQSENSGSTWLKLGNDGFETRIVNGLLWIRSRSAMLGYLNAPSPFNSDGWFNTQDEVEVRGDYVPILRTPIGNHQCGRREGSSIRSRERGPDDGQHPRRDCLWPRQSGHRPDRMRTGHLDTPGRHPRRETTAARILRKPPCALQDPGSGRNRGRRPAQLPFQENAGFRRSGTRSGSSTWSSSAWSLAAKAYC